LAELELLKHQYELLNFSILVAACPNIGAGGTIDASLGNIKHSYYLCYSDAILATIRVLFVLLVS